MADITYGVRRRQTGTQPRSVGYRAAPKPVEPAKLLQAMRLKQESRTVPNPFTLNTAGLAQAGMASSAVVMGLLANKKMPDLPDTPAAKGRWAQRLAGAQGVKGLAKRIERLNGGIFDVAQLEGFQGEGQITSGHSPGSQHYEGDTFDVNTVRGNNTDLERRKLARLFRVLTRLGYLEPGAYQNPWEANVGSTGRHGHAQTIGRYF